MIKSTILAFALVLVPALVLAHSESEATEPADGATVTEVSELTMRFDDPMRIITVVLTSPDGEIEIERETDMDPTTEFRAAPAEDLAPGLYQFEWRGMASDGHPMQGSFSFTVAE